jgi:hypothetical protein
MPEARPPGLWWLPGADRPGGAWGTGAPPAPGTPAPTARPARPTGNASPLPSPRLTASGQASEDEEQSDPGYEPGRRVEHVLPLGMGLALVGLGIGFLGWRLRRT